MQFFEVLVHFLEIGVHDVVVRGLVIRILIGTGILRVRVDRDARLLEQLLEAAGSGRHLGGVLRFDGALGLLDALGDGGLLLFAHALRGLAGLIDELLAAVARDGLGLELRVLRGVLLRFPHPSDPNRIPDYVDERVLYQTFGEQSRWGKLMGIDYAFDLNRKIEEGKFKELIQLSEALHERRIVEIADMITKQKKRIILIAGPSSSGKTTFAQRLCIQLRVNGLEPLYMGTDDYFLEREQTPVDAYGEKNYEDLDAVDIHLFNSNMNDLLAGKQVDLPTFDFLEGHKKYGKRLTRIRSNQPIVIEGIHALNDALTPEIAKEEKFKIYISPLTQLNIDAHNRIVTTDHRMLRRMVRDFKYRGYSAQNTIQNWPKVRAGEDKNIFPYSNEADVMFNSVHLYELCVLKKYALPLLEAIQPDEPEYSEAQRMRNFLRFFKTVEDDSAIVNNSILREFIGGSVFVD